MDQADARERHEAGLVIAPSAHGCRPLGGATQLVHLVTAVDHAAIDEPRDDRRQLVRRRLEHRLVQLSEAIVNPTQPDQGATLIHQCKGEEIGVAEALGDLGRGSGDGECSSPVAGGRVLKLGRKDEVSPLDAVTVFSIEQTLDPTEPSPCARSLAAQQQMDHEPERAAHRAPRLARLEISPVRALQRMQLLLVAADHVGRRRQTLEILRVEPCRAIGAAPATRTPPPTSDPCAR